MYQRILVCLNPSERTADVARAAADFASRYNAHVLLLCVHENPSVEKTPYSALSAISVIDQQSQQIEKCLREALQVFQQHNTLCDVCHNVGDPAEVILKTAREQCADVIVMGSYASKKWWAWLNKSVGEKVARHAPCTIVQVADQTAPESDRSRLIGGLGREAWGGLFLSD